MDNMIASRLRDFSCGLFFMFQMLGTVMLYLKGRHHRLQHSAFRYMLYLLAISVFEFYVFFIHNFLGSLEIPLTNILQMSVIPISFMLLYRLTHQQEMPQLFATLNIAPYFIAIALYAIYPIAIVYYAILYVALVHIVSVIGYGFLSVRRFNNSLKAYFSSDENLSLHWLWLFLALLLALAVTWIIATIHDTPIAAAFYNVMCTLILAMLCYFVYRQEDMLEALGETRTDNAEPPAEQNTENITDKSYHFQEELSKAFCERQIYLDSKLNINVLARELGTNRTYISNYLNQQLHTNFYEYVNHWRIIRAKELLATSTLTLEEVVAQSGFNSLSTFRRYFLKAEGMTPNEYRMKMNITTNS